MRENGVLTGIAVCHNSLYTLQVPSRASSLNTNDVFIIETNKNTYIWVGQVHILLTDLHLNTVDMPLTNRYHNYVSHISYLSLSTVTMNCSKVIFSLQQYVFHTIRNLCFDTTN